MYDKLRMIKAILDCRAQCLLTLCINHRISVSYVLLTFHFVSALFFNPYGDFVSMVCGCALA